MKRWDEAPFPLEQRLG